LGIRDQDGVFKMRRQASIRGKKLPAGFLHTVCTDIAKLEIMGLLPSKGKKASYPVKVLASVTEDFTKTVHIKANAFSKRAVELIEKNGGKAEVV
jgi:ribosomal protein L15